MYERKNFKGGMYMNKKMKRALSAAVTLAMAASALPMALPASAEAVPLFEGDTVLNEWKFDFGAEGSTPEEGYTLVTPDRNIITDGEYGFIGNDGNGDKVSERYDSFNYQPGQVMRLQAGPNGGIGIVGADESEMAYSEFSTGEYYPVSFGLYVDQGTYYRVRATVTTLDPEQPAQASLYYERRHPVYTQKTIEPGESYTVEFSVDVENIYFEKTDPKGLFEDDMLNISLLGENSALASLDIQQIDESKGTATTLWVLGDSTVTDGGASIPYFDLQNYTGVGAYLSKYVPKDVAVSNHGEGGLNANDNNHFNQVATNIKAGDYMYVEYGHNHKNDKNQSYSAEYWLHNYLNCLPKYYNACKEKGATLIVVGPIDRHNSSQYDAESNTWSSTLGSFSEIGKNYVDCLLYSGEETANAFIAKWAEIASTAEAKGDTTALKEEAQKIVDDAKTGGKNGVSNVAFVDLNAPSLAWLTEITASGTIEGKPVTNDISLTNYYFQTAAGGGTDGTHPNDAGADACAYRFFTTADAEEYPAIAPLLANFAEGAQHEVPMTIPEKVFDAGSAPNSCWPVYQSPISYDYAAQIKSPVFDENGVIQSVDINVQAANMMSGYSSAYFALYDENGVLKGVAISSDHIDNTNGNTLTTLHFDTDLKAEENDTYKIFLWSYLDDPEQGNPITMIPYAATYIPSDIDSYLLAGENNAEAEDFDFYSAKYDGTSQLSDYNGWKVYGSAGHDLALGESGTVKYARIMSDGAKNGQSNQGSFYIFKDLEDEIGSTGTYMISADIQYTSGSGLNFGLVNGYSDKSPFINEGTGFTAFTIGDGGALMVGDTNAGTISAGGWTNVVYTLNMDTAKASVSVAGGAPVEIDIPNYAVTTAPSPNKFTALTLEGQKVPFDIKISNLVVAKLAPQELPEKTVTVSTAADASGNGSGTVKIDDEAIASKTVPQSTFVKLSAAPDEGSVFINWTDGSGTVLSTEQEFNYRLFDDLNAVANFAKQSGIDGITSYSVVSDKGLVKAAAGEVCSLALEDIVDAAGNPVIASNTDVEWSCDEPGVTFSEDGKVSLDENFVIDDDTTKDVTINASLNNVEKTYVLTVYSYDFYENVKDGKMSSAWDGVVTVTAERDSIAFPGGGNTSTLTLPSPVSLDEAKTMSFIAAGGGSQAKFCGQPRYIEIYDSTGAKVINDVIGYSWESLCVGGTIAKDSITDPKGTFSDAVALNTWSGEVTITMDKAAGTATVAFGGQLYDVELNTNAADIASIKFIAYSGAPDYLSRCLAVTDITIK